MTRLSITVEGCDDETVAVVDVPNDACKLLDRIFAEINRNATGYCKPRIKVEVL